MNAPIVLPPKNFVEEQRKAVTSFLFKLITSGVTRHSKPSEDECLRTWTSWPNKRFNAATLWGLFVRMDEPNK